MDDDALRDEINKRFTLNWLIQGAAQHACMTLHHVVRDELDAVDRGLVPLYDQLALMGLLQYWHLESIFWCGWPPRFWRRAVTHPKHPFFRHPVLSRHGGMLAEAARQRARERCRERRYWAIRFLFGCRLVFVLGCLHWKEARHSAELIRLAKKAVTEAWGIPPERMQAQLTTMVRFGNLSRPRTLGGWMWRACAIGYGGVVRQGDSLAVHARGTNWLVQTHELVKATAELVCLHGLNGLSEDAYQGVVQAADGVDFEPWMLHSGGELWRRLLTLLPRGRPVAEMLMHLARLPARSLNRLVLAVIEEPDWARELLAGLGEPGPEPDADLDEGNE